MTRLSPDYWTPQSPKCPRLFLAPMEGLCDRPFRMQIAKFFPHFDEACSEFIRLPINGHIPSLIRSYDCDEIFPIPFAAQIMCAQTFQAGEMAHALECKGASRVELNCGCPSNTVVGRGAGSSLLKTPETIYTIVEAMVKATAIPISVKMRLGVEDDLLFEENIRAITEAGADFIVLHPRTKLQGYRPPCRWEYIAKARQITTLPIVGSGDVKTAQDALDMFAQTQCHGIMVGRAAVSSPWIFAQIRASFDNTHYSIQISQALSWLQSLYESWECTDRQKTNRLKQIIRHLFAPFPSQQEKLLTLLRTKDNSYTLLEQALSAWKIQLSTYPFTHET